MIFRINLDQLATGIRMIIRLGTKSRLIVRLQVLICRYDNTNSWINELSSSARYNDANFRKTISYDQNSWFPCRRQTSPHEEDNQIHLSRNHRNVRLLAISQVPNTKLREKSRHWTMVNPSMTTRLGDARLSCIISSTRDNSTDLKSKWRVARAHYRIPSVLKDALRLDQDDITASTQRVKRSLWTSNVLTSLVQVNNERRQKKFTQVSVPRLIRSQVSS